MKTLSAQELKNLILASFEAERTHDVAGGLALIHPEFRKTDMYVGRGDQLFPTIVPETLKAEVDEGYAVEGRFFEVVTMAADEATQTVFVEMVEGHPRLDGVEGMACAPIATVCQVKDGLIWRTRAYTDPDVAWKYLSPEETLKVVKA